LTITPVITVATKDAIDISIAPVVAVIVVIIMIFVVFLANFVAVKTRQSAN
jgi:hypothetical protein